MSITLTANPTGYEEKRREPRYPTVIKETCHFWLNLSNIKKTFFKVLLRVMGGVHVFLPLGNEGYCNHITDRQITYIEVIRDHPGQFLEI